MILKNILYVFAINGKDIKDRYNIMHIFKALLLTSQITIHSNNYKYPLISSSEMRLYPDGLLAICTI